MPAPGEESPHRLEDGAINREVSLTLFQAGTLLTFETSLLRWKYMLKLAIDANFRMKSKDREVVRDYCFDPGWSYMVEEGPYKEELAKHHDDIQVVSARIDLGTI